MIEPSLKLNVNENTEFFRTPNVVYYILTIASTTKLSFLKVTVENDHKVVMVPTVRNYKIPLFLMNNFSWMA